MQFGWHYILDLAWIISHIDIPPGCKILDAGAGGGILQYLLAIRGYRYRPRLCVNSLAIKIIRAYPPNNK
ncbi:MAG: hypothetical protein DRP81_09100 [Candidatus Omnitrophota bacterium]|nr:MAG: hypothetical protein DRP81_09100 [Candidatus Omnitrophota bacterium]